MSAIDVSQGTAVDPPTAMKDLPKKKRLVGIDAARGLALIGLMAVHIFPSAHEDGEPTLAWTLFSGDSAALFALLAGVGLALSTGGATPHRGRQMAGHRAGLAVRAVLVGLVAVVIAAIMPEDPPVDGILLYYAVFFLLTIPFLHLRSRVLFLSAAALGLVSPVLMSQLAPVLPESSASNHTLVNLFTEPAGTLSELLLTGAYPALTFMSYLLAGLGLGRLNLRSRKVQALITGVGAGLAVAANALSALLLNVAGGHDALLATEGMGQDALREDLVFGPDILPDTSAWWLAIVTPHSGTSLAIADSLGVAMLVLGVFLLLGARAGRWLTPLAAMGSMTLTLYSVHLLALVPEVHYDDPFLWLMVHLGTAAAFAGVWHRTVGRGPLEQLVAWTVQATRQAVAEGTPGTYPAGETTAGTTGGAAVGPAAGAAGIATDGPGSGPARY